MVTHTHNSFIMTGKPCESDRCKRQMEYFIERINIQRTE